MLQTVIKIGGASGYWGDSARATPQLLTANLDYIVYDYLAEITMSIMARAYHKDNAKGYAIDFVTTAMQPHLPTIADSGVKIIANAGGINPQACVAHLRQVIEAQQLNLKVAAVIGDNLLPDIQPIADSNPCEMFDGSQFPDIEKVQSINAYLGAFPIASALSQGADIVVTGRCVDSALTLGACIHEFGWQADDYDRLAAGSLAGHILECGTQACGGNFTDWHEVKQLDDIGYPIGEIDADGNMVCTKIAGTSGLVSVGTVSEQMLYEIGDPQAYLLPDVSCDFSQVRISQQSQDHVTISGAIGYPPTGSYKVSATYADGFRGGTYCSFYGIDANSKAQAFTNAVFRASQRTLTKANLADFSETSVEILGAESQYGDYSHINHCREVVLKIAAKHPEVSGIKILLREITGLGLATPPGLSGFQGGRPTPSPVIRLYSLLIPKSRINIRIDMGISNAGKAIGEYAFNPIKLNNSFDPKQITKPVAPTIDDNSELNHSVKLVELAWARSGDKGDKANIGVIARRAEFLPYIWAALTHHVVTQRLSHFINKSNNQSNNSPSVQRFLLPGSHSINFLIDNVLGGGGIASLRNDPQGKGYAQLLLDCDIKIPVQLISASH